MPTYQYACTNPDCGNRFDLVQKFTDPAADECPVCGSPVRKVFSPVGVVFKGSGFYRNDSREGAKKSDGATSGASADGAKDKSKGKDSTSGDSTSKPAADGGSGKGTSSSTGSTSGSGGSSTSSGSGAKTGTPA